jgi:hypothetical protein
MSAKKSSALPSLLAIRDSERATFTAVRTILDIGMSGAFAFGYDDCRG